MPASQHQSPKSDIEISQAAKKRPIVDIARERLGIAPENLEPYGHYKAKVSMDFVKSLQSKPNGKLILVSAINADAGGRGQDHDDGRADRRAQSHRQEGDAVHARAVARPVVRRQGRRRRRRLRPGRADGGHQSAFHRRLPRHHLGEQSARRAARQPHLLGQCARHRRAPRGVAPRARHERSRAALDRVLARRRRQRISARGRLRHHRRVGGHGDLLPGARSRRSQEAARQYRRRLYARPQAGPRRRSQGARRHDRAAQGSAGAEPGADARRHARLHPRRSVRQYRARLQFGAGDDDRAQARRLRRHRSRLRRRPRRREVHGHQMPQGRHRAGLRRCWSPPSARSRCTAASRRKTSRPRT